MMAGSKTLPSKGRIQMSKTNYLQIVISGLQRTAGPYRSANRRGKIDRSKNRLLRAHDDRLAFHDHGDFNAARLRQ